MENEEMNSDRIERFLRGQMPPDERAVFEKELRSDTELAWQTAVRQTEMQAIERLIERELRSQMLDIERDVRRVKKNRRLGLAFAALVLGGLAFWFFSRKNEIGVQTIPKNEPVRDSIPKFDSIATEPPPADLKKNEPNLPKTDKKSSPEKIRPIQPIIALATEVELERKPLRGEPNENPADTFSLALEALKTADFDKAMRLADQLLPSQTAEKLWLRGNIFFRKLAFSKAKTAFAELLSMKTDTFHDRDEWMLLLSLAAEKGISSPETEGILKKIEGDPMHPFRKDAQELRKVLKR